MNETPHIPYAKFILPLIVIPLIASGEMCQKKNLTTCMKKGLTAFKHKQYKKAVNFLELPCRRGFGSACALIGTLYAKGSGGLQKDRNRSKDYWQMACDKDYAPSCRDLGNEYRLSGQMNDAINAYKKGCENKGMGSCYNLATLYYFADDIPNDLDKAKSLYHKVCEFKDSKNPLLVEKACLRARWLSATYKGEAKTYASQCRQKEGESCHNLGALYYQGKGLKQSFRMEIELDTLACHYGYAMGCKNVGLSYYKGEHIEKNTHKAISFFKMAGALGEGSGFYNAGDMYQFGAGVALDYKAAFEMYKYGCFKMDMHSCERVGYFFEHGLGMKPDGKRAAWFYKAACDRKEVKGCYNMAFMYVEGDVVKQDLHQARKYFKKACALGNKDCCSKAFLQQILKKKSTTQSALKWK